MPSQRPALIPPISASTRSRISFAARLVKVTARIWLGQARFIASRSASLAVSTRVLPVPAPESTSSGPSSVSTASRCGGFSPASQGGSAEVAAGRVSSMKRL